MHHKPFFKLAQVFDFIIILELCGQPVYNSIVLIYSYGIVLMELVKNKLFMSQL